MGTARQTGSERRSAGRTATDRPSSALASGSAVSGVSVPARMTTMGTASPGETSIHASSAACASLSPTTLRFPKRRNRSPATKPA